MIFVNMLLTKTQVSEKVDNSSILLRHRKRINITIMPKILLKLCVYASLLLSSFAHAFDSNGTESNFDLLLNHTNYGVADGLSQDTVTAIVEDSEGYVWVGTINGLNRFDGNEFKQFYAADDGKSLPSSFIRNLLIDNNGALLVGTDKGLVQFDSETESFSKNSISEHIGEQAVWSLSQQGNEIFVGLNNKFIIYDNNTRDITYSFKDNTLKEVKKIIKFENTYFIRNYEGYLIKVSNKELELITNKSNEIANLGNQLIIAKNDGIYTFLQNSQTLTKSSNLKVQHISSNGQSTIAINGHELFHIEMKSGVIKANKIGFFDIEEEKLKNHLYKSKMEIYTYPITMMGS